MIISACSNTVPLKSPLRQPPLVEKTPISVAILYLDDLQHHKCIANKGYIAESWTIELGSPSIEMFNLIFASLFATVMVIDSGFDTQEAYGLKGIIEVNLQMFDGCDVSWPIVGKSIEVSYKAILRDIDGTIITSWEGRGRARSNDHLVSYAKGVLETGYLSATTSIAMRKAAADFIINFKKDAVIHAWTRK